MHFCFYPNHEYDCPNVSHCPHLGGAALGTLVLTANQSGDTFDVLHKTIDAERTLEETIAAVAEELGDGG